MPCTLGMRWGLCTCSSREVAVLQLSVVVGRVLEAGSACDSCVWGGGVDRVASARSQRVRGCLLCNGVLQRERHPCFAR